MGHGHHHHSHFHYNSEESNILIKLATSMAVLSAFVIIVIKFFAWIKTDSLTILATLADSMLDIISSIINLIAVRYAMQPADNEHRFGHGKAEDLAVFCQSAFFGVSGIFLIFASVKRIFIPEKITNDNLGMIIMIISIVITTFLVLFQKYVIKKTNSHVVAADHLHYSVDLFSNIAVIVALLINKHFHFNLIDPIFALGIAAYVMYGAWQLLKRAFNNLMDREFDNKDKEKIYEIVTANIHVKGVHDLKTRYGGSKPFIQFHLMMDSNITLLEAHHISNEIEKLILKDFPNAEILIHQDPDGIDEEIAYLLPT